MRAPERVRFVCVLVDLSRGRRDHFDLRKSCKRERKDVKRKKKLIKEKKGKKRDKKNLTKSSII